MNFSKIYELIITIAEFCLSFPKIHSLRPEIAPSVPETSIIAIELSGICICTYLRVHYESQLVTCITLQEEHRFFSYLTSSFSHIGAKKMFSVTGFFSKPHA